MASEVELTPHASGGKGNDSPSVGKCSDIEAEAGMYDQSPATQNDDVTDGDAQSSETPDELPAASASPTRSGWLRLNEAPPLSEMAGRVSVAKAGAHPCRTCLSFLGPAALIMCGYVDPGNWATNLAAGSEFGYLHLFVILISSLTAMFLQSLAVRLGVGTGRDLAQACRDAFPRPVAVLLWLTAEVAIMATDVAEVVGTAVALKLLFKLPLVAGVCLTVCDALVVAFLHSRVRLIEGIVATLMMLIFASFLAQVAVAKPPALDVFKGFLPSTQLVTDTRALYLAIGILGATVMPHNIYLHSAVVHTRAFEKDDASRRAAARYLVLDAVGGLSIALLVNCLILIVAAAAFNATGHSDVGEIQTAFELLQPVLGSAAAPILFGVALFAAGQNSTLTGVMAGQVVMEGFLEWRVNPVLRRVITRVLAVTPVLVVALVAGDGGVNTALVLSQVILSFQLPFALVPLMMFTSDARKMGADFVNGWARHIVGWALVTVVIGLNAYLLIDGIKSGDLLV